VASGIVLTPFTIKAAEQAPHPRAGPAQAAALRQNDCIQIGEEPFVL